MKGNEWSSFMERVEDFVEYNPDGNEAEIRSKIVEPVLREQGWSFIRDIKVEHSIQFSTSIFHVDYTLTS